MLCAGEPEPPAGHCCGYPSKPPAMQHGPWNETEIWWVCISIIIEIPQTVTSPVKHTGNHGQHLYLQSLPFSHRNYICLLQNRVITVDQDLISLPCSESNIIQSLTAATLDLHQGHCDQTLPLCLFPKEYLEKDAKSIFSPAQALAKSMSYVIKNLSPSGHTYFKYYHHLCKIHAVLQHWVLQGAQWDQAPQWTQCHCLQNILGHRLAQLLTESAHKGPGKAGERGRAYNLHSSSFMQEMSPFIWVKAPCRLITLPTTVGSGIWLPGEKSDTFLIALEVRREYSA